MANFLVTINADFTREEIMDSLKVWKLSTFTLEELKSYTDMEFLYWLEKNIDTINSTKDTDIVTQAVYTCTQSDSKTYTNISLV